MMMRFRQHMHRHLHRGDRDGEDGDFFSFEDHDHRFHRGMRHHGHHRGRRRVLDSSELRLVLLQLIADEPRHGYDLIQAIGALSSDAYTPSPGMVYPALALLEDTDMIAMIKSEGARKAFEITEAGAEELERNAGIVAEVMERLSALTPAEKAHDAAPVRRALDNLKTVLRNKLYGSKHRDDLMHDIAALIDQMSQQIERLK